MSYAVLPTEEYPSFMDLYNLGLAQRENARRRRGSLDGFIFHIYRDPAGGAFFDDAWMGKQRRLRRNSAPSILTSLSKKHAKPFFRPWQWLTVYDLPWFVQARIWELALTATGPIDLWPLDYEMPGEMMRKPELLRRTFDRLFEETAWNLLRSSKMIREETLPVFFRVNEFRFSDNGAWSVLNSFLVTIKAPQWTHLTHLTVRMLTATSLSRHMENERKNLEGPIRNLLHLDNIASRDPYANLASFCVLARFKMPRLRRLDLLLHVNFSIFTYKPVEEPRLGALCELLFTRPQIMTKVVLIGEPARFASPGRPLFRIGGKELTPSSWGLANYLQSNPTPTPARLLWLMLLLGYDNVVMTELGPDGYDVDNAELATNKLDRRRGCFRRDQEI